MNAREYVLEWLPEPPLHVLELGCGRGELALAIADAGYDVLAIDPRAPDGEIFRSIRIEELDAPPESFGALVASLSLHHVHDLPSVVDRLAELLPAGGRFVLDEFDWEALDAPTAAWVRGELRDAGRDAPATAAELERDWRDEHSDLHTGAALLDELERRFERLHLERRPFLAREVGLGDREAEEARLIESGEIAPLGLRWVGARR